MTAAGRQYVIAACRRRSVRVPVALVTVVEPAACVCVVIVCTGHLANKSAHSVSCYRYFSDIIIIRVY